MKRINPNGVAALANDVQYLTEFVDTLGNPVLRENLDELQQTVALLQAENSDEFYDVSTRNKKYGRVDTMNGPALLEKYVLESISIASCNSALTSDQTFACGTKLNENRQVYSPIFTVWHEVLKVCLRSRGTRTSET